MVCKDWAEKLRHFHEDFHIHLNHCYLRNDIEPVSLLMNSTRHCHSLSLSNDIHTETTEVPNRFLSHFGKDVQDLDIRWLDRKFLEKPNFLLFSPQLKKLTVGKLSLLSYFKWFPEKLEHVHLDRLYITDRTDKFQFLRNIKNLKLLTANMVEIKGSMQAYVAISPKFMFFALEEDLKSLVESMHHFDCIWIKCNTNFIGTPTITLDDVSGIEFQGEPSTFFAFNEFRNLRSVRISWKGNQQPVLFCFNFHRAVLCPKVVEFTMDNNKKQSCIGCFNILIDSFPNLEKIVLTNSKVTNLHVKYMCLKLPQLKHLETDGETVSDSFGICYNLKVHFLI